MHRINKVIEKYLKNNFGTERQEAALGIRNLLLHIDNNAEVIPVTNLDMLTRLIASLKEDELSEEEMEIISEIVQSQ